MNRKPFDEIARQALPFSRRWIAGGLPSLNLRSRLK